MHHRIRFKKCTLVHKCLHGLAPSYLIDMIGSVSKEPGRRHLRSAAHGDLVVPTSRTRTLGQRAFAISGPDSWNNIPVALRETSLSFHEFCVKLKTEFISPDKLKLDKKRLRDCFDCKKFLRVEQIQHTYLLTYLRNPAQKSCFSADDLDLTFQGHQRSN